jgi:hypothetical protein
MGSQHRQGFLGSKRLVTHSIRSETLVRPYGGLKRDLVRPAEKRRENWRWARLALKKI